jgi:acyl carrier protein
VKSSLNKTQLILAGLGIVALCGYAIVIFNGWPWYFAVGIFVAAFVCFSSINATKNKERIEAHFSSRPVLSDGEFGSNYFPAGQVEIATRLRKILAKHVGIDLSRMNPTDRFIEDLLMDDFDSMATVEFVIAIEKEFEIKIPDSVAEKLTTFQNLVDYVAEAVKSKAN